LAKVTHNAQQMPAQQRTNEE